MKYSFNKPGTTVSIRSVVSSALTYYLVYGGGKLGLERSRHLFKFTQLVGN